MQCFFIVLFIVEISVKFIIGFYEKSGVELYIKMRYHKHQSIFPEDEAEIGVIGVEKQKMKNKLIGQIVRFSLVGFLCFFIDYGLLLALTELAGFHYLVSGALSFAVSVVVNYLLSMKFVYEARARENRTGEFITFVLLSLVGLLINQLVMWVAVEFLGIWYQLAKIGATAIVMVYNFVSRKIIIER